MDSSQLDLSPLPVSTRSLYGELYTQYKSAKATGTPLQWSHVHNPPADWMGQFEKLEMPQDIKSLCSNLIVLKLNGGLGTSMGCTGPKSLLPVIHESDSILNFLDITVKRIARLNKLYGISVPLVLMNSDSTHEQTLKALEPYKNGPVDIFCFKQNYLLRLIDDSSPHFVPDIPKYKGQRWYPPGHGDVYRSLYQFLKNNKPESLKLSKDSIIFSSNIDNLGATISLGILNFMAKNDTTFMMEVTKKTIQDIKGGMPILYGPLDKSNGYSNCVPKLLEGAQVPPGHMGDFTSLKKFDCFNTNNLWFKWNELERLEGNIQMDIIINPKKLTDGTPVIQLEQACGAALQSFTNSKSILVPRSRFLPVKKCNDLLLVQSNVFSMSPTDFQMYVSNDRTLPSLPNVRLGSSSKKVVDFEANFSNGLPSLVDSHEFIVSGHVLFGKSVTLKNTVIIVNPFNGKPMKIPDNSTFDDVVVTFGVDGSLQIRDL